MRGRGKYKGELRVRQELRNRIQFFQHNLLEASPQRGCFEVIFLRNALIYFEHERKLERLKNLLSSLLPGGLLFVGHAEPLHALPLPGQRIADAVFEKVA